MRTIIAAVSLFCFSFSGFAATKVMVHPSELLFAKDAFYYVSRSGMVPVISLQMDQGQYVATLSDELHILGIWVCPNCGKKNSKFDGACVVCGHEQPQ